MGLAGSVYTFLPDGARLLGDKEREVLGAAAPVPEALFGFKETHPEP